MALNKIFMKRGFLNYLMLSGILFANIINPNKSIALTQENIDIPKVVSTDQHHVVVAKNGSII